MEAGLAGVFGGVVGGLLGYTIWAKNARAGAEPRWRHRRRALLLGVVLGSLAILLFLGGAWLLQHWLYAWLLVFVLGLFSCLVLPGVEGFLTARQSGEGSVGHGMLVGGIGFLVVALAVAVLLYSRLVAGLVIGLINTSVITGLAGAFVGVVGGLLGYTIWAKNARAGAGPRGDTPAGDALSSSGPSHEAR